MNTITKTLLLIILFAQFACKGQISETIETNLPTSNNVERKIPDSLKVLKQEKIVFRNEELEVYETINRSKIKIYDSLWNQTLVGLATVNQNATSEYKKFGLDFATVCYCDSPSIYLNNTNKIVYFFNYCASFSEVKDSERCFRYSIHSSEEKAGSLILSLDSNLVLYITPIHDLNLFQIQLEGSLPKNYIGSELKQLFTSQPDKFVQYDCGDFDG